MVKQKTREDKIVEAHPHVGFLTGIQIKGEKDMDIRIGGFTCDGGLILDSPYEIVKEEKKGLCGDVTYYNFVKNSKKMSDTEEKVRKNIEERELRDKEWKENRIKDIKEELAGYEKDGVNATEEETEEEK